ncbi:hypothetical protein NDN08_008080 [Rhodosorus marinus]|uniref:Proteasome inhibitor PI31 subunit n=1 Tax=Rhodosorus marinus TaxID=101924 RepID=A0AAV8UZQ0_9RHOD|nr:hypothetical protein NDN08_008080 [Rhodosorus marinus]
MVSAGVAAAGALQWLSGTVKSPPKDRHEAAAFFVHAVLLQHGFRPASCPAPEPGAENVPEKKVPENWNSAGYGGLYKHYQSGLNFELRMVPLGGRLLATATIVEQDKETYTADLRLDSYVRDDAKFDAEEMNWDSSFKNVQDLASVVQLEIAYKLVPESSKGSRESGAQTAQASSASQMPEPQPSRPLGVIEDDPLRIGPPRVPGYAGIDSRFNPVGGDDLIPSGLYEPGMYPAVPGTRGPGGGSLVGPDHPMFAPRRDPDPGLGGPRLPRGAVPPGARFDPFGPPGAPGGSFDPSRFGPDPDHDRPPPDMYF